MLPELSEANRKLYEQVFIQNAAVKLLIDPAQNLILDANPAATRFYGFERKVMLGMPLADLELLPVRTGDASIAMHYLAIHRLASNTVRDVEVYRGELDLDNQALQFLLIHDITALEQRLTALPSPHDQFQIVFEQAGIGIAVIDMHGRILEANTMFQAFLGYTEAELRQMNFADFTYSEDIPRNLELFDRMVSGKETRFQMEKRYVRRDNTISWGRVTVSRLQNTVAQNRYAVIMIEDISDRKEVETALYNLNASLETRVAQRTAELAEANSRLQELDRVKSRFIENVSHELRTPVTNLKTYLHLLTHGKANQQEQYIGVIKDEIDRLGTLVNDLLDLTRLEAISAEADFEDLDLGELVGSSVEGLHLRAVHKGVGLMLDIAPELPPIQGDKSQLMQLITNLLSNAIKYTPEGSITVTLHRDALHRALCLRVADTGLGIPPEDLPHVFERFFRGDNVHGSSIPGTGLGLAIVQEIVKQHRGQISVESVVNQGTTFTVLLPENGAVDSALTA